MNIKTNTEKLPPRIHSFHKIFNRNTVKISCMRDMNSIISVDNCSILNLPKNNCACNSRGKTNFPLQKKKQLKKFPERPSKRKFTFIKVIQISVNRQLFIFKSFSVGFS